MHANISFSLEIRNTYPCCYQIPLSFEFYYKLKELNEEKLNLEREVKANKKLEVNMMKASNILKFLRHIIKFTIYDININD